MSIFVYSFYTAEAPIGRGQISKLPLDPIRNAGVINKSIQERLGGYAPFALDAFRTLNERQYLEKKLIQTHASLQVARSDWRKTKAVWKDHVLKLKSFNVLAVAVLALLVVSTYFAVSKSCGTLARSIFSGRNLSQLFFRPASVNLPQLPHVLAVAATFLAKCAECYVLTSDVRHYFHAIALGREIQEFFTIFVCSVL
jgi:hypothetical protein